MLSEKFSKHQQQISKTMATIEHKRAEIEKLTEQQQVAKKIGSIETISRVI